MGIDAVGVSWVSTLLISGRGVVVGSAIGDDVGKLPVAGIEAIVGFVVSLLQDVKNTTIEKAKKRNCFVIYFQIGFLSAITGNYF
jgi:hypothetical protein